MPVDPSLVGRSYPPTPPYAVTVEKVREFAAALGRDHADGPVPPTFPIVVAGQAMNDFLAVAGLDLSRIVHGEQRFAYSRPLATGDVLTGRLEVTGLRSIGGSDIISTATTFTDAAGEVVCTATATLVHRAPAEPAADDTQETTGE